MTREEAKSCICTIKMLQKLAYNIHGVMDVVDADNCKKIIKALEQESILDILDKIRAEIKDWQTDIHDNECDAENHDFVFERIYEIIDEYKEESEVNK